MVAVVLRMSSPATTVASLVIEDQNALTGSRRRRKKMLNHQTLSKVLMNLDTKEIKHRARRRSLNHPTRLTLQLPSQLISISQIATMTL